LNDPARARNLSQTMSTPAQTHSKVIGYLVTLGLFGIGLIYDFWTLNSQKNELNLSKQVV